VRTALIGVPHGSLRLQRISMPEKIPA